MLRFDIPWRDIIAEFLKNKMHNQENHLKFQSNFTVKQFLFTLIGILHVSHTWPHDHKLRTTKVI